MTPAPEIVTFDDRVSRHRAHIRQGAPPAGLRSPRRAPIQPRSQWSLRVVSPSYRRSTTFQVGPSLESVFGSATNCDADEQVHVQVLTFRGATFAPL